MNKEKLTNEQKFIKDIEKIIKTKLKKYGLTNAMLLLPDKEGHYQLRINKPLTQEQLDKIPTA